MTGVVTKSVALYAVIKTIFVLYHVSFTEN